MKPYFFFLLLIFASATSFAQQNDRGAITVLSRQPVMMAIDNRLYDVAGTELTIGNIPRGPHNLQIYQARTRRGRTVQGYLLFETIVRVQPGNNIIARYNPRWGTLRISNRPMGEPAYREGNDQQSARAPQQQNEDDVYNRAPDNDESSQPDMNIKDAPSYQLTAQQLSDLRTQIAGLATDTKKKEQLQSVLGMKTYTVAQLKEMAGWLEFESERLDFLKWAYTNTEDKANYNQLADLFRYESSKKELRDYVAQQQ